MSSTVGIGLIGLGIHGKRYARHLLDDVQGASLVAVCRSDRVAGRAWAAENRVSYFGEFKELIRSPEVDAVIVVTPPDVGAKAAGVALRAGKPVLLEKPLAASLEAGRELVREAERVPTTMMVAQTLRWNGVVSVLLKHRHEIGQPVMMALNQRFEPSDRPWLDQPEAGGVILNTGVHGFDLVRYLSGREVVEAWCRTGMKTTRNTPDIFTAVLRLDDGTLVTVDNCRATAGRSGRIEWVGEKGQLVGDHVHNTVRLIRGRTEQELAVGKPVPTVREATAAFVAAVRDGTPVPVTARDGFRALEVVMACRDSASSGHVIRLQAGGPI